MDRTRYLAILFLNVADNHCYRNLKTKLFIEHLINKDAHPNTYEEVLKLLNN